MNKQNSLLLSLFNIVLRIKIFQLLNCCMSITTHTEDFSNNSLLNCSTIQVQNKVFTLVGWFLQIRRDLFDRRS